MAISEREFCTEIERLQTINTWLQKEIVNIEENKEKLKEKINEIKKSSKSYNVELEIAKEMYNKKCDSFNRYKEAENQPYFARIDFKEELRECENYYIGKFGLYDSKTEEEKVIDWRAPIGDLYYSGTQGKASYEAPKGKIGGELLLKRKFLFKQGDLIDAFDEGINDIILKVGAENEGNALIDEFLKINLEESTSKKLKDVVATIQKEQNHIIRADIRKPTILQGSAGSGKTTIALHRLAYLLYRYKDKIGGKDILVIAPNKLFLDYISEVLPSLGVDEVKQTTFENFILELLSIKKKIYTKDQKLSNILECKNSEKKNLILNSSKLRGEKIYKKIIDRYILYLEKKDIDILDIKLGEKVLFEKKLIKKLYSKDLIHLPMKSRKEEIKRYLMGRIKEKVQLIGEEIELNYSYKINKLKASMKDGEEKRKIIIDLYDQRDKEKKDIEINIKSVIKDYFNNWNYKNVLDLYYDLFINKDVFHIITEGKLPNQLYEFMLREIEDNIQNNYIDADDLAPLAYMYLKIYGKNLNYKHTVVDEVQDYSLFQLEVLKNITTNTSMTLVGDVGQGIYYYKGINDWSKLIETVFHRDASYVTVTQSYRSTIEIINFANRVLEKQKNSLKPAKPVLRHGEEPKLIEIDGEEEFISNLINIIKHVEEKGKNTIAIIGKDLEECKNIYKIIKKHFKNTWTLIKGNEEMLSLGRIIIPSYMTKGLEFDCSIIYNCSQESYRNIELDKKLLYVALTRALHYEYVFYKGSKSKLLD